MVMRGGDRDRRTKGIGGSECPLAGLLRMLYVPEGVGEGEDGRHTVDN